MSKLPAFYELFLKLASTKSKFELDGIKPLQIS